MNEIVILFCMRLSTNMSFDLENINQLHNASTWCNTFTLKQLFVNGMVTYENSFNSNVYLICIISDYFIQNFPYMNTMKLCMQKYCTTWKYANDTQRF